MSDDEDEDISMADDTTNNDSVLSRTPPSAKKQKKAPAPKKGAGKPLATIDNEASAIDIEVGSKNKSASDRYQKVSRLLRLTHILS